MKQQHRLSKKQRQVLKLLAERPRHRLEPEMWGWVAVEDLRDPFLGERPDGRYSSAEMLSAVRSARRSVAALAQQGLVITEARYFGWDPAKEEGSGAALAIAEASPAGCEHLSLRSPRQWRCRVAPAVAGFRRAAPRDPGG